MLYNRIIQQQERIAATINEGESYQYDNGVWSDWKTSSAECNAALSLVACIEVQQSAETMYERANMFYGYEEAYREAMNMSPSEEGKAELAKNADLMKEQADKFKSVGDKLAAFNISTAFAIDNWSIKMYADEALRGDVNGNGVVNVVDAQVAYEIATKRIAGGDEFDVMKNMSDVNGDGFVEAADARAIQSAALLGWKK